MPPIIPTIYNPALPDISPYVLPYQRFDDLITKYGIRVAWGKGHSCPCVYGGQQPGSPDPACLTCRGRGTYWDALSTPFIGLITFIHTSPTPDEPGTIMDEAQGLITNGEPALTIPFAAGGDTGVWGQASIYDLFVEVDAINRMNVSLIKGQQETLPYPQGVTVAPSGAVTIYDPTTTQVVTGVAYTVSGTTVTLASSYAPGTPYIVDYICAPTYVAYRQAGIPAHIRPFGQLKEPRRFRLQQLDLWTRSRSTSDIPHF